MAKHKQGKAPKASVQVAPPAAKLPLANEFTLATRLLLREVSGKISLPSISKEAAF